MGGAFLDPMSVSRLPIEGRAARREATRATFEAIGEQGVSFYEEALFSTEDEDEASRFASAALVALLERNRPEKPRHRAA
jgi:hypothetical protein